MIKPKYQSEWQLNERGNYERPIRGYVAEVRSPGRPFIYGVELISKGWCAGYAEWQEQIKQPRETDQQFVARLLTHADTLIAALLAVLL